MKMNDSTKHKKIKNHPERTHFLQGVETKKLYLQSDTKENLHKLVKEKFPSMDRTGKIDMNPVYPEAMRFVTGKVVNQ